MEIVMKTTVVTGWFENFHNILYKSVMPLTCETHVPCTPESKKRLNRTEMSGEKSKSNAIKW